MSRYKLGILMAMLAGLTACSTPDPDPQRGFDLPPALREVFRGGQLKGLENAQSPDLGMPSQYDMVSHTCISTPTYDLWGRYRGTEVRCF